MRPVRFLEILSSGLNDVPSDAGQQDLKAIVCELAGKYLCSMRVLGELGSLRRCSWIYNPSSGIVEPFRNVLGSIP